MIAFTFDLMPGRDLPYSHVRGNAPNWSTVSDADGDPGRAADFHQRIERCASYDRPGFDSVPANERHQTGCGLMPSPNIVAAGSAGSAREI